MDKYLIDLFLLMELTTLIISISKPLSLKSSPETQRISLRDNSRTAAPFDLKSFDDRLIRISAADSLQARPNKMAFKTSGESLLCDNIIVRKNIAVEKNFLIETGTTASL